MTDCRRLARHLARHLSTASLAFALGAGCAQPAPPPPIASPPRAEQTTTTLATEPADAAPTRTEREGPEPRSRPEPPFPVLSGMCDSDSWCGNADAANSRAADDESPQTGPCTHRFEDDERYFFLDEGATERRRLAGDVDTCCYTVSSNCVVPGRPLVIDGHAVLAPVARGPAAAELDELRARVGEMWLDDARAEHASIASFARAAVELLAVGAPLELVAACQRAGLDEVRHAELCLGLAERYLGQRLSLGALPVPTARPATLARLAADTFEEGCVGETTATLMAERALESCADREVARVWQRIVRDERRHAELAWRTVAWAVETGGAEVRAAIEARALRCAPGAYREPLAEPGLARHGRLDTRGLERARRDAWHEIIVPTLALLSR